MIHASNYQKKTYLERMEGTTAVAIGDHILLGIPLNLNIDRLMIEYPFLTRQKKLRREVLKEWLIFFVAYFYRRSVSWDEVWIEASQLKKIWESYAEITHWLEHVGVLIISEHSQGNFPRRYMIHPNYDGLRLTPIFETHIIKKAKIFLSKDEPDKRTAFLRPFLDQLSLENTDISFLKKRREDKFRKSIRKFRGKWDMAERAVAKWDKTIRKKLLLTKHDIEVGMFDFIPDDNTTRLYTTISMMVSDQRAHLRYQGQPLWEADMSSAMPFFALAILLPSPFKALRIGDLISRRTQLSKHPKEREEFWSLLNKIHNEGVSKYQNLVSSGKLYDFLVEKSGKSEDRIKEELFWALFDKSNTKAPLKKTLVEEFSDIMRLFDLLKTGFVRSRKEGRKRDEPTNGKRSGMSVL